MPKGSKELTDARRDEILSACLMLYKTKSFKEITIKDIGSVTSFTRTSIYNYFHTKEEIFLGLFKREYEQWREDLVGILAEEELSAADFCDRLAKSLQKRQLMLKLMSTNLYDMEENCRPERLKDFKGEYGRCLVSLEDCLIKFFPKMDKEERDGFIYSLLPFMFGIYPYTCITDKQKEAMDEAGVCYKISAVYDLVYNCTIRLLLGGQSLLQKE